MKLKEFKKNIEHIYEEYGDIDIFVDLYFGKDNRDNYIEVVETKNSNNEIDEISIYNYDNVS